MRRLWRDERGQAVLEDMLTMMMVGLVVLFGALLVGEALNDLLDMIAAMLSGINDVPGKGSFSGVPFDGSPQPTAHP